MCFLNEFATGSQHHLTSPSSNSEGCKQGDGGFLSLEWKSLLILGWRKVNEFAIFPAYFMSN